MPEHMVSILLTQKGKKMSNEPKIFLTSDTHWFHENVIQYCNRPWQDIDQMGRGLVKNWNNVVRKKDIVYHLGDVAMGGPKRMDDLNKILNQLNGTIRLIRGNHDTYIMKEPCVNRFEWVKDYHELKYTSPNHGKRKFILCHYPLLTWNGSGRKAKDGNPYSVMLHGHCHGNIDDRNRDTTRMDMGVDSNNYAPIWIENIVELMNHKTYDPVDHHAGH